MSKANDIFYLRRSIDVSKNARKNGNTPFGAILVDADGQIVLEQENIEVTQKDSTGHAETTLIRNASKSFSKDYLATCTLYTSCEPCAMCSGAIFWSSIRRVVYAMSEKRLLEITGNNNQDSSLDLPCREVFARGPKPIEVIGPFKEIEIEAAVAHDGFWD